MESKKFTMKSVSNKDRMSEHGLMNPSKDLFDGDRYKVSVKIQDIEPQDDYVIKEMFSHYERTPFRSSKTRSRELLSFYPNITGKGFRKCNVTNNNFFNAFFLAWKIHGELVLSPDDIWF